jgi:hypothetical protein
MKVHGILAAVAAVATGTGCYTSAYTPRQSRELRTVYRDGAVVYLKDGKVVGQGELGGLVDATANDPPANDAAREARRDSALGSLGIWGGRGLILVGGVLQNQPGHRGAGATVLISGCLLDLGLTPFTLAAGARYLDALNQYDDDASAQP